MPSRASKIEFGCPECGATLIANVEPGYAATREEPGIGPEIADIVQRYPNNESCPELAQWLSTGEHAKLDAAVIAAYERKLEEAYDDAHRYTKPGE